MPRSDFAKPLKFFIFDAILVIPLIALPVHPSKITFGVLVAVIILLWIMSLRGMGVGMFGRFLRTKIIGNSRLIRPWYRQF